jgi:hypothetical protein
LEIPVDIDPCSGDIDPPLKWFGNGITNSLTILHFFSQRVSGELNPIG